MRVLGLDPGLVCAGFGVIEQVDGRLHMVDYGAIRTPAGAVPDRLMFLYDRLRAIVSEHLPDAVAVERVLFNANTKTAMSVGQAAGIALLVAAQAGCEIAEYTANEVKLSVTGYGSADKSQVQTMIARLLGLRSAPEPPDAADALGLALMHLHARKLKGVARGA